MASGPGALALTTNDVGDFSRAVGGDWGDHFGLPAGVGLVDVEVTVLVAGTRVTTRLDDIDPAAYLGRYLEIRR